MTLAVSVAECLSQDLNALHTHYACTDSNRSSITGKASGARHLSIRFLKLALKVHVVQEARTVIKVWHAL